MKKYVIAMMMAMVIGMTGSDIHAQKHRHDPRLVRLSQDPDTMGIEAYSDTTATDTAGTTSYTPMDQEWDEDLHDFFTWNDVKDLLGIGIGGTVIAVMGILLVALVILSPIIFLAFIIYLLVRSRNRRYRLAEKAMENGQPIPDQLVQAERQSDDYQWRRGIRNIFLGTGIAVMCYCLSADPLAGIGWLIAICGVGQAVIARSSSRKGHHDIDKYNP